MKRIFTAAMLSAFIAAPAFAADAPVKAPVKKSVTRQAGDCDAWHDMSAYHGRGMMDGYGGGMMGGNGGGMMGGYGNGMMLEPGLNMLGTLSLSKEQQGKINKISDELKHNNWATLGLMNDETSKLRDLYQADKRDPAAIGSEYQKIFDLKRQLIVTYLEAENRIEEVLTPDQLARLKEARSQARHRYMH